MRQKQCLGAPEVFANVLGNPVAIIAMNTQKVANSALVGHCFVCSTPLHPDTTVIAVVPGTMPRLVVAPGVHLRPMWCGRGAAVSQ